MFLGWNKLSWILFLLYKRESHVLELMLLGLLLGTPASDDTISVNEVVRLVKEQDLTVRAATEAVTLARAGEVEAGLYSNPTLTWDREHFPGDEEDTFSLTLPVDLSMARTTRKGLAGVEVARANAEAARLTSEVVAQTLRSFYRLLFLKRRAAIEGYAVERLVEAARVVRRRREEGNASGYDLSRIEIEAELAASFMRQTEASVVRLRQGLASRLGISGDDVHFSGALEADETLAGIGVEEQVAEGRSSVKGLRVAALRAGEARRAAAWSWLPGLALSGGARLGRAGESRQGYVVGVALDLPVFSRGQELRVRAAAQEGLAVAEVEKAEREARRELIRAWGLLVTVRAEVVRLAEATGDRLERLERASRSGYREGELSIVELLDAGRARTELELRQLQLALSLKEAEVAVRAARGEYE